MENNEPLPPPQPLYPDHASDAAQTFPAGPPPTWYPSDGPPRLPPTPNKQSLPVILASVVLAILAVVAGTAIIIRLAASPSASSSGTTTVSTTIFATQPAATQAPGTAIPTETPTIAAMQPTGGSVVYTEQWANGTDGWMPDDPANQSWSVIDGKLSNDGTSCCMYIAPYHPTSHDYALEAQVQMSACSSNGGSFGLFGQGNPAPTSNGGYAGYVAYWGSSGNFKIRTAPDRTLDGTGWVTLAQAPYQLDAAFHTFRVEFSGGRISFFLDGNFILATTNSVYSGSDVGLEDLGCQIDVTSFRVFSLA